jgi:hypothetical protein
MEAKTRCPEEYSIGKWLLHADVPPSNRPCAQMHTVQAGPRNYYGPTSYVMPMSCSSVCAADPSRIGSSSAVGGAATTLASSG